MGHSGQLFEMMWRLQPRRPNLYRIAGFAPLSEFAFDRVTPSWQWRANRYDQYMEL
jgi:hypothetical protein